MTRGARFNIVAKIFHLCALSTFWQLNSPVNYQRHAPLCAQPPPLPPSLFFPAHLLHAFSFTMTGWECFMSACGSSHLKLNNNLRWHQWGSPSLSPSNKNTNTNKYIAQRHLIGVAARCLLSSPIDSQHWFPFFLVSLETCRWIWGTINWWVKGLSSFVVHSAGRWRREAQWWRRVSTLIRCSVSLVTAPEVRGAAHDNHHYSPQHSALSLTATLHQWASTSVFHCPLPHKSTKSNKLLGTISFTCFFFNYAEFLLFDWSLYLNLRQKRLHERNHCELYFNCNSG